MFDQHVPLGTLTALPLAGQFVGNVLPSTIGGDVLRVSRVGDVDRVQRDIAFASVAIERLTGSSRSRLLVFVGFALEAVAARRRPLAGSRSLIAVATIAAAWP